MTSLIWFLAICWVIYRVVSFVRGQGNQPQGTARLPCRHKNCPHTILPDTAQRTGGLCMPCFQGRSPRSPGNYNQLPGSYNPPAPPQDTIKYEAADTKAGTLSQKQAPATPIEPRPLKKLETPDEAAAQTETNLSWQEALLHATSLSELSARQDEAGDAARQLLPHLLQPADHTVTCLARPSDDLCIPLWVEGPSGASAFHAHTGEWTPAAEEALRDWIHAVKANSTTRTAQILIVAESLPTSLSGRASQA